MKLDASHFKSPEAASLSSLPAVRKIGQMLAGGIATAFAEMAAAAWRAVLEGILEETLAEGEEQGTWIRIETRAGSVALHVQMDRPLLSAICEVALGGTGTEEAVDFAGRPLSNIEKELAALTVVRLADVIVNVFADQLAMPVRLFDSPGAEFAPSGAMPGGLITFRFLLNVFNYSGEIRISAAPADLTRQLEALRAATSDTASAEEQRAALQSRIGEAETGLTVTLGSESMLVEELAALQPGRMLRLNATTQMPVIVLSAGVRIFTGTLARAGDRLAVRLTSPAS